MAIIDEIKVEEYLIRWIDDNYSQKDPFYARFGILETAEQHQALSQGLDNGDPEWVSFDENIFYWISSYLGESIKDLDEKVMVYDFVYVGGEDNE